MFFVGKDLVPVTRREIEYSGYFDFNELYEILFNLMENDLSYEVHEKEYIQKDGGEEVEIRWECKKKVTGFMRYKFWMTIYAEGLKRGVKVKQGVTADKGDVEVYFTSYLETDYMDRWEGNKVLRFLKKLYKKYLYKRTFLQHMGKIGKETWSISDRLRSYFRSQREKYGR